MENCKLESKRNSATPIKMEAQEDILKDEVHDSDDANQEFQPIVRAGIPTTLKKTGSIENLIALDEKIIEEPIELDNMTLPNDGAHAETLHDDKQTGQDILEVVVSSKVEKNPNPTTKFPTSAALTKHQQGLQYKETAPETSAGEGNQVAQNQHRCDFCDETFAKRSSLKDHRARHLEVKGHQSTQCHICFSSFKNRHDLKSHFITHTSRFKCEYCSKTFQRAKHLEVHIGRHLGIKPHQCTVCEASFAAPSDLKAHALIHSERKHKCDICGRAFLRKILLEDHKNVHLTIKPHKCAFCTRSFAGALSLRRHNKVCRAPDASENRPGSRFKCKDCMKTFKSSEQLEVHVRRHLDIKLNQSDVCDQATLKRHRNVDLDAKPHKCNFCASAFSSLASLTRHVNLNHKSELQNSERGQNTYNNIAHADQTVRQHKDIGKNLCDEANNPEPSKSTPDSAPEHFICQICSNVYRSRYALLRHVNRHTSRFKCKQCSKTFQSSGHLKDHVQRHLGIKSHQCDLCERAFIKLSALQKHRHDHLEIKLQKCTFCTEAFSSLSGLTRHMNLCHKSDIQDGGCWPNFYKIVASDDQTVSSHNIYHRDDLQKLSDDRTNYPEKIQTALTSAPDHLFTSKIYSNGYSHRKAFTSHLNMPITRLKCEYCTEAFQSAKELEDHIKRHLDINMGNKSGQIWSNDVTCFEQPNNSNKGKRENTCNDLQMLDDYEAKDSKFTHVSTTGPPYICQFCSNAYAHRATLARHLISHTSRFRCEECGKRYQCASDLERHIRSHLRNNQEVSWSTTTSTVFQEVDHQTEDSNSNGRTVEPLDAEINVQIESQDSVLKDAIFFNDEPEFKPIVNVSEEVTDVQAYNPETKDVHRTGADPIRQQNILNEEIVGSTIDHAIKIEQTELSEEEIISADIFCPINLCHVEFQEIQKDVHVYSEEKSDEIDSFNKVQHLQLTKEEPGTPVPYAENEAELSDYQEFLSKD